MKKVPVPVPLSADLETPFTAPSLGKEWAAGLVWSVWGIQTIAAFALVILYGSNVPWFDEWDQMIPYLTGAEPVTLGWLWELLGESRWPLTKLIYLGLIGAVGDFRVAIYFNTLALVLLSLVLIQTAKAVRGSISYADAFFPLALLHWGHYQNMLWSMQVVYLVPITLELSLLCLILRRATHLTGHQLALAGACLLLLPLCGGWGLIFAFPLAVWLGACGLRQLRFGRQYRRAGAAAVCLAVAVFALIGLYFKGYGERIGNIYVPESWRAWWDCALQFLAMAFGPAGVSWWPVSSYALVICYLVTTVAVAVFVVLPHSPHRLRALGLLVFLAAVLTHAAGVGWGRSSWGMFPGFVPRYATLAVVGLCCMYFAGGLCAPSALRHPFQVALCILALLGLSQATTEGLKESAAHRDQMSKFEADVQAGAAPFRLAQRHTPHLAWIGWEPFLQTRLAMLQKAGFGAYRRLQRDPQFQEVPVEVMPSAHSGFTWEEEPNLGYANDAPAYLEFTLPERRYVVGIQIRVIYLTQGRGSHAAQVTWKKGLADPFPPHTPPCNFAGQGFTIKGLPPGKPSLGIVNLGDSEEEQAVTIWIDEEIQAFRFYPEAFSLEDTDFVPDWVLRQLDLYSPRARSLIDPELSRMKLTDYAIQITGISLLVPTEP